MPRLSISRPLLFAGLLFSSLPLVWGCAPKEQSPGGKEDKSDKKDEGSKSGSADPGSSQPKPDNKGGKGSDNNDNDDDNGKDDNKDPGDEGKDSTKDEGAQPKFDIGALPDYEPNDIGCDVDFLFVVDNSNSMADSQKSLSDSVPKFIETITTEIKDLESYHIGVISTDESWFNGHADAKNCATLGGLTVQTQDFSKRPSLSVCIPYANKKNFMTNPDDLAEKFKCAAELGANGNGANERPMGALKASYSKELTKAGACNEGFFRKDAILVVVIITDEEDDHFNTKNDEGKTVQGGSKGNPEDWYKDLLALKDNKPEYLVVLSLVGTPEPNACEITHQPGSPEAGSGQGPKSAEIGARIIEFTKKFGKRGAVGDVCAENYDPFFDKAVSVLSLACDELPG